jgi:hypothetical protein
VEMATIEIYKKLYLGEWALTQTEAEMSVCGGGRNTSPLKEKCCHRSISYALTICVLCTCEYAYIYVLNILSC